MKVPDDPGMKLENAVACALMKEIHFREDCFGEKRELHYLKNKDGREVDFLIMKYETPTHMIEVKWADSKPSPNFPLFDSAVPGTRRIQIVKELLREKTFPGGIKIRTAHMWLADFKL